MSTYYFSVNFVYLRTKCFVFVFIYVSGIIAEVIDGINPINFVLLFGLYIFLLININYVIILTLSIS